MNTQFRKGAIEMCILALIDRKNRYGYELVQAMAVYMEINEGTVYPILRRLTQDGYDFAYIHVEAPDEMGHQGSLERKLKAIEFLDERVIKVVKEQMDASGVDYRMLVTPDHPTPIAIRTHSSDPIPFLLYDSTRQRRRIVFYNEKEAMMSGIVVEDGYQMIDKLLED